MLTQTLSTTSYKICAYPCEPCRSLAMALNSSNNVSWPSSIVWIHQGSPDMFLIIDNFLINYLITGKMCSILKNKKAFLWASIIDLFLEERNSMTTNMWQLTWVSTNRNSFNITINGYVIFKPSIKWVEAR